MIWIPLSVGYMGLIAKCKEQRLIEVKLGGRLLIGEFILIRAFRG